MPGGYCKNQYDYPNYFDPKYHNSPQFSFGVKYHPRLKKSNSCGPGPKYDIRTDLGKGAPYYSIGRSRKENIRKTECSPGPGAYHVDDKIRGKYTESKFRNASGVFLGTSAKRFAYKTTEDVPGPKYSLPPLVNGKGYIYESKYKSNPGVSFSGKKISLYKNKSYWGPGPGAYDIFSEFEGYENKNDGKIEKNKK